nr:immunoglobulin light chain junction region [Macaca mulatta]MOX78533.1 immunoglobulin light chain junction region [Macaca mulatta]MOX80343.1 immunoglobulin light chain junction region [Macaca mulatta]MOX82267.1 immunoglobulin light chain junction region [Macaca mulatta]MOX82272.1 immunoglobulin light chain junction region [Macaca mulatta]
EYYCWLHYSGAWVF